MKLKEFNKNLSKEFNDTFQTPKPKRKFQFKIRYVFGLALGCLFLIFLVNHIYVQIYNSNVEAYNAEIRNRYYGMEQISTSNLVQIKTSSEYQELVNKYKLNYTLKEPKTSLLSTIFTFGAIGCSTSAPPIKDEAPGTMPDDAYHTNIQTAGIDEEDIAKCDGKYIYTIDEGNTLNVYNLKGDKIISVPTNGDQIMIYKNKIITLGDIDITIYSFEEDTLKKEWDKSIDRLYTARLKENDLYIVAGFKNIEEKIDYSSCYYDNYSNLSWMYSIICIDLNTLDVKQTQNISSSNIYCYMSNSAVYLASYNNFMGYITTISMYDLDLEPVGVMRVRGNILNQFSMDEYENYFRVVSTDTNQNAEELNRITIFKIKDEFKEIGCLKNGIGIGRQTVKSVRFNKTKCYIVTYENKDPLYEIDCSDPTNPRIVSSYEAPGYSSYLHTFKIGEKEYILGLGYTDSMQSTKISLYENTTQIGKDFVLSYSKFYDKADFEGDIDLNMFSNHKALFFYQTEQVLYLGFRAEYDSYIIFKIDVNNLIEPIHLYKKISIPESYKNYSRAFLVEGNLYITTSNNLEIISFES